MAKNGANALKRNDTQVQTQILHQSVQASYSGPLPQAEEFQKYDLACPGAADRILKMAEQQAAHRQGIEKSVVEARNRDSLWGIVSATVIALSFLAAGTYCVLQEHDWAGVTIITGTLVGLCSVFIYGTNSRKKEE